MEEDGFRMDFVWVSCGFRVDFVWISCGFRVDFVWISCEVYQQGRKQCLAHKRNEPTTEMCFEVRIEGNYYKIFYHPFNIFKLLIVKCKQTICLNLNSICDKVY